MKEKLYLKNSYEKSVEIIIKNMTENENNFNFEIPNTLLFKGYGNKIPGDKPIIEGVNIIKYAIKDEFIEITSDESPKENLLLEIDWNNRLKIMQNNLANIVLAIAFKSLLNIDSVDYKIGVNDGSLIINTKDLTFTNLKEIEELVNYLIRSNLPVKNLYDNYSSEQYVIKIGQYEPLKYIGPILKRTGELALLKITSIQKVEDQMIRVNYITADTAYRDYVDKFNTLNSLKTLLKISNEEEILNTVKELKLNMAQKSSEIKNLQEDLGLKQLHEFIKSATTTGNIHVIYKVLNNINFKDLKTTSAKIMEKNNYIQIYGIPNGSISQILVCRSHNLNVDLKAIYDDISEKHDLKGGGNIYMVQANCPTTNLSNTMEDYLVKIKAELNT